MKTFKFLLISFLHVTIVLSCNLPGRLSLPTQTLGPNPVGTFVEMTTQAHSTRTQVAILTPTLTMPTVTASPVSTRIPPNVPVWSTYNYTCELADGGGAMTMNLAWTDRSNSEEGYKIYRNGLAIATLSPNSTFYVDVAFVATGNTLSYKAEAFNNARQASTSTITYGCQ